MPAVYRLRNVTKVYRTGAGVNESKLANNDISLDIHEGEIFGLLGPNGAGKTTLVNQISGLLKPSGGSIHLYGLDVVEQPDCIADYVALQPQSTMALYDLLPHEAIYHTGRFRGLDAGEAQRQTAELVEELGIHQFATTKIRYLSGGQRKLVTLAVAFVAQRPVMIFDEPTNELDPAVRKVIWHKILQLNRQGTTVILVTHNVMEAEQVVQRVGIINNGQLLALGTPGELKSRVDRRVRLELLFKQEAAQYTGALQQLGEVHMVTNQRRVVLCHRDVAQHAIEQVLRRVGLDRLDDFRIVTPSLEDVYLQLGGGGPLGEHGSGH